MANPDKPASKRTPPLVYIVLAGLVLIGIAIFANWRATSVTPSGIVVPEARPAGDGPVMPQRPTADSGGVPATTGAPATGG